MMPQTSTTSLKRVTFTGVAPPLKYDLNFIMRAMRKHHTGDPEKTLKEEHISFDILTLKDYDKLRGMKEICSCYGGEELSKNVYLNRDNLVIFVSDRRSTCVCQ